MRPPYGEQQALNGAEPHNKRPLLRLERGLPGRRQRSKDERQYNHRQDAPSHGRGNVSLNGTPHTDPIEPNGQPCPRGGHTIDHRYRGREQRGGHKSSMVRLDLSAPASRRHQ